MEEEGNNNNVSNESVMDSNDVIKNEDSLNQSEQQQSSFDNVRELTKLEMCATSVGGQSRQDEFDLNIMNTEHIEKFKKYEADFKQYLMAKYFSDKTIYGGNIFDVKMNIEGQTIMASRLPPYQSYLDPATFDELLNGKESVFPVEGGPVASTGDSNGISSTQGN